MHAIHRPSHPRAQVEGRKGALLGHEEVLDLDVVTARPAQAAHVPGVHDARDGFRIEIGDPDLLITVGPEPGRVAVEDLAGAVQRRRVHAAAGEEPVAGHSIATRRRDRPAAGIRRSRRDADRITEEDLAAHLGRELRALAQGVDPHRQAPARRAVGARDLLDHVQGREDVGAQPTFGLGQRHPEEAGVGDVHDELVGQLSRGLDLGGPLADARRERARNRQRRGRCRHRVGDHGDGPSCASRRRPVKTPISGRRRAARGVPRSSRRPRRAPTSGRTASAGARASRG